jgi:hypothetical protein
MLYDTCIYVDAILLYVQEKIKWTEKMCHSPFISRNNI